MNKSIVKFDYTFSASIIQNHCYSWQVEIGIAGELKQKFKKTKLANQKMRAAYVSFQISCLSGYKLAR